MDSPSVEAARHGLYSRLEEVLGPEHADTLMEHLPQHRSAEVATKGDIAAVKADIAAVKAELKGDIAEVKGEVAGLRTEMLGRFDRMEDRFDSLAERMDRNQRFYVATTFGALTAMTAIFSFVVTIVT